MKTKKMLLATFVVSLLVVNTSCLSDLNAISGKGNIVSETRYVSNFTSVELLTSANVEIVKGDTFDVQVSDYENIIEYIDLKMVGDKLIICTEPESANVWNSEAKIRITMPDILYSVKLGGSGTIKVGSAFNKLQYLSISGSGDINVAESCSLRRLETQITGSGNMKAFGNVEVLKAKISGSGSMYLSNLKAKSATCTLTGSGKMFVNIENTLDAYLSGSGDIIYSGNPVVNSYLSGSGRVYKN
jgi:hypothetical protein